MVQRVEQREKAQTALALMFAGPSRRDDARFATAMIAGVASGSVAGSSTSCATSSRSATPSTPSRRSALAGSFVSYIATSPEKEEVARRGLLNEFAKLRATSRSSRGSSRQARRALGVHAIRQQSGGAVLGEMVDAFLFGRLAELDEFEARACERGADARDRGVLRGIAPGGGDRAGK